MNTKGSESSKKTTINNKPKIHLKSKDLIITKDSTEGKELLGLIEALVAVDIAGPRAALNASSMSDNNGGEIIYTLTEDMVKKGH